MNIKKENMTKIAVKNSLINLSSLILLKAGGMILTIILARMLLPELFGLYSLALSIAIIAITATDFGMVTTGVRYVADALGKNDRKKARSYFTYLFKFKAIITLVVVAIVLILSKPLSEYVFNKPVLFVPLIATTFYVFIESLRSFFATPFSAKKEIGIFPPLEATMQASKIGLSLLAIYIFSGHLQIAGIFVAFAISGVFFLVPEVIILLKKDKDLIFGEKEKVDKKKIIDYMFFVGLTGLTLAFFGSIDTLMLGTFVDAEYLGFYRVALNLVLSISALLPFAGILLPIFTQIHGKRLDRGFRKSFRYLIILSIPMAIGLIFISKYAITLIYGKAYLQATSSLLVLSVLIIVAPLIALYTTIFKAKEKPRLLAKAVTISLIINIVLNYILIKTFLGISQEYAIVGAGIATLTSKIFFLGTLIVKTRSQFKLKIEKLPILKSVLSAGIMALFILAFRSIFTDMTLITGILMIVLSAGVYFISLILIKGLDKEDWETFKFVFKRK